MEACESVWIHDPEALRGKWRSLMPSCRELRVEVGCGKGKFTVETAEAEPDVLLIAIERVQDALVLAMEAAIRKGLKNVFFVSLDAANIDQFFADDEIDRWPSQTGCQGIFPGIKALRSGKNRRPFPLPRSRPGFLPE